MLPETMSSSDEVMESELSNTNEKSLEKRKSSKPVMEKRRRARINNSLNELKTILLEALKKESTRHSKLEKADILEMTVNYLRNVERQRLSMSLSIDPTVLDKYKAGFNQCRNEVMKFLSTCEGVTVEIRTRLLSHLASCLRCIQSYQTCSNIFDDGSFDNVSVPFLPNGSTPCCTTFQNNTRNSMLCTPAASMASPSAFEVQEKNFNLSHDAIPFTSGVSFRQDSTINCDTGSPTNSSPCNTSSVTLSQSSPNERQTLFSPKKSGVNNSCRIPQSMNPSPTFNNSSEDNVSLHSTPQKASSNKVHSPTPSPSNRGPFPPDDNNSAIHEETYFRDIDLSKSSFESRLDAFNPNEVQFSSQVSGSNESKKRYEIKKHNGYFNVNEHNDKPQLKRQLPETDPKKTKKSKNHQEKKMQANNFYQSFHREKNSSGIETASNDIVDSNNFKVTSGVTISTTHNSASATQCCNSFIGAINSRVATEASIEPVVVKTSSCWRPWADEEKT